MSDAQHYRTKEEVEEYKKIDPITQVKDVILEKKYASEEEIKDHRQACKRQKFQNVKNLLKNHHFQKYNSYVRCSIRTRRLSIYSTQIIRYGNSCKYAAIKRHHGRRNRCYLVKKSRR